MMLIGETFTAPYQIRGRYTFSIDFEVTDDPYLDRRWSAFSNDAFDDIVREKSSESSVSKFYHMNVNLTKILLPYHRSHRLDTTPLENGVLLFPIF